MAETTTNTTSNNINHTRDPRPRVPEDTSNTTTMVLKKASCTTNIMRGRDQDKASDIHNGMRNGQENESVLEVPQTIQTTPSLLPSTSVESHNNTMTTNANKTSDQSDKTMGCSPEWVRRSGRSRRPVEWYTASFISNKKMNGRSSTAGPRSPRAPPVRGRRRRRRRAAVVKSSASKTPHGLHEPGHDDEEQDGIDGNDTDGNDADDDEYTGSDGDDWEDEKHETDDTVNDANSQHGCVDTFGTRMTNEGASSSRESSRKRLVTPSKRRGAPVGSRNATDREQNVGGSTVSVVTPTISKRGRRNLTKDPLDGRVSTQKSLPALAKQQQNTLGSVAVRYATLLQVSIVAVSPNKNSIDPELVLVVLSILTHHVCVVPKGVT